MRKGQEQVTPRCQGEEKHKEKAENSRGHWCRLNSTKEREGTFKVVASEEREHWG